MLTFEYYVAINYAPFIGILLMLLVILLNRHEDIFIRRAFLLLLILELVEMTAYSAELYFANLPEPSLARILLSSTGYSIRPIMVYLIIILNKRDKVNCRWIIKNMIPLIVNTLLSFSAVFTGAVFSYTAGNHFSRGPLGYVPQFVTAAYLLILAINVIGHAKQKNLPETIIVLLSIIITMIVLIIETYYTFSSLGRATIIIATIFYYMCFQTFIYRNQLEMEQRKSRRFQKYSTMDQLTGLLNKTSFMNRMDISLLQAEGPSGLIFFDLDHFKVFNDTLGHLTGDDLLKEVAQKLRKLFRSSDLIGRFGGDEFYVYMTNISYELLEEKARKLMSEMEITWADSGISVSASMGICFIPHGETPGSEKVLQLADCGLYEAKRAGRNCYRIYTIS